MIGLIPVLQDKKNKKQKVGRERNDTKSPRASTCGTGKDVV